MLDPRRSLTRNGSLTHFLLRQWVNFDVIIESYETFVFSMARYFRTFGEATDGLSAPAILLPSDRAQR